MANLYGVPRAATQTPGDLVLGVIKYQMSLSRICALVPLTVLSSAILVGSRIVR